MHTTLATYDYRFFIIDLAALHTQMAQLGKTRTRNIMQFWQKQPDAYHQLCRQGALFPIQNIRAGSHALFIVAPHSLRQGGEPQIVQVVQQGEPT